MTIYGLIALLKKYDMTYVISRNYGHRNIEICVPPGRFFHSNDVNTVYKHIQQQRFYWDREKLLKSFRKYNRRTFMRVIMAIYNLQTSDEKSIGQTFKNNKSGFDRIDAPYFQRIVESGRIPEKEFAKCQGKMIKYWRQLCSLATKRHLAVISS